MKSSRKFFATVLIGVTAFHFFSPSADAQTDETSQRLTALNQRVERLVAVARTRKAAPAQHGYGLNPVHRQQLEGLEKKVSLLESLLAGRADSKPEVSETRGGAIGALSVPGPEPFPESRLGQNGISFRIRPRNNPDLGVVRRLGPGILELVPIDDAPLWKLFPVDNYYRVVVAPPGKTAEPLVNSNDLYNPQDNVWVVPGGGTAYGTPLQLDNLGYREGSYAAFEFAIEAATENGVPVAENGQPCYNIMPRHAYNNSPQLYVGAHGGASAGALLTLNNSGSTAESRKVQQWIIQPTTPPPPYVQNGSSFTLTNIANRKVADLSYNGYASFQLTEGNPYQVIEFTPPSDGRYYLIFAKNSNIGPDKWFDLRFELSVFSPNFNAKKVPERKSRDGWNAPGYLRDPVGNGYLEMVDAVLDGNKKYYFVVGNDGSRERTIEAFVLSNSVYLNCTRQYIDANDNPYGSR